MSTKLTLTVDKSVIEKAKAYARKTGRSLSELIETYLDSITENETGRPISPKLKSIVGAIKLPRNFNEDEELRSYHERKHL